MEHSRRKMAHRYDRYRMLIGGQRVLTKHVRLPKVGQHPAVRVMKKTGISILPLLE
jgi:hypothetical protein